MSSLLRALLFPDRAVRVRVAILMLVAGVVFFFLGTREFAFQWVPPAPYDKLAHLVVFGGFAGAAWVMLGARGAVVPVLLATLLGVLDEGLQSFTPGRDADTLDLVADLFGAWGSVAMLQTMRAAESVREARRRSARRREGARHRAGHRTAESQGRPVPV